MNKNPKTKSQAGFTFIEFILVLIITVILAAVGFVNVVNYKQRQNLSFAGQEIIEVLRNAQNRSLSQESGSRWGVYFGNPATGTAFYDLFLGAAYSTSGIVSRNVLPSGIQFNIPASGASSSAIFSPLTGLPNSSTTIKISLISIPTASATIIVSTSGMILY